MPSFPKLRSAMVVGALATLAMPAPAQSFEGVLSIRMTTPLGAGDATYSIKGDKLRMDMTMGGMGGIATIVDRGAKKMYVLMTQRSMYMERDLADLDAEARQQSDKKDFTWTGKKETVAGHECEHATVKDPDGTQYDMCIARGLGFYSGAGQGGMGSGGGGGGGASWQRHVQDGFPLKVQKAGDAEPQFEVTKIEKKALKNDFFTPPAGWQKFSMPMGMPTRM